MAALFFDTSAFVKRYLLETGSPWVRDLMRPSAGHRIYVAWIAGPEVIFALTRGQQRGDITEGEVESQRPSVSDARTGQAMRMRLFAEKDDIARLDR
jgi:predicted nucleic acid-binding protein